MATGGDGSENAPARSPVVSYGIADDAKRLVEFAIGEAITFKQVVSTSADAVLFSARSGLSQILSSSTETFHEAEIASPLV
ncbi:hypothetical protein KSP40_PGU017849 [Platanthera guangdongensis]|uniref:Uncharacterized protein n=1 Tax=Platanthera guangdongensis TaxID=2320717 RepID=A0ABR2N2D3_9ASPA